MQSVETSFQKVKGSKFKCVRIEGSVGQWAKLENKYKKDIEYERQHIRNSLTPYITDHEWYTVEYVRGNIPAFYNPEGKDEITLYVSDHANGTSLTVGFLID